MSGAAVDTNPVCDKVDVVVCVRPVGIVAGAAIDHLLHPIVCGVGPPRSERYRGVEGGVGACDKVGWDLVPGVVGLKPILIVGGAVLSSGIKIDQEGSID